MQNFTYTNTTSTYPIIQCGFVTGSGGSGIYTVTFPTPFPVEAYGNIFVTSNFCENSNNEMVSISNYNITNTGFTIVSYRKNSQNNEYGGGPNYYWDMNWIAIYTTDNN